MLVTPAIDNVQGTVKLSAGTGFGQTATERVQIATIQVKLKQAGTAATLTPVLDGPRNTNIASTNGSIMAEAHGVTLSTEVARKMYLPIVTR